MPDLTASHAVTRSVVPTLLRVGVCGVTGQCFTSSTMLPLALQKSPACPILRSCPATDSTDFDH